MFNSTLKATYFFDLHVTIPSLPNLLLLDKKKLLHPSVVKPQGFLEI